MKATLALLLASSVNAAASPSKTDIGATFPLWKIAVTDIQTAAPNDVQDSNKNLKITFTQNQELKTAGWYAAYRTKTVVVTALNGFAQSADGALAGLLTAPSKGAAFYNASKDDWGTHFAKQGTAPTDAATAKSLYASGDYFGVCPAAAIAAAADSSVSCPFMTQKVWSGGQAKTAMIYNRTNFAGDVTTGNALLTVAVTVDIDVGGVKNHLKVVANYDIMMAAAGQANGTDAAGNEWCTGSFYNKVTVATTTTATVKGGAGFGPKGKCTWQVVADDANTHAPVVELEKAPRVDTLFQVVEWYNNAAVGTAGLLDDASLSASPGFLGKTGTLVAANGVFFNPITTTIADIQTSVASSQTAWSMYNQDNANVNLPNTIGTAIWSERDAGQGNKLFRTASSMMITSAYDVYNAQKTTYETAKTAYETDKTAYETAFEAAKKDAGKTTVPTRPDMPTAPSAYAGPQFYLGTQIANPIATTWTNIIAKTGAVDAVLANVNTAGVLTFDQSKLAGTFHTRVSYLTAAQDNALATNIKYVGATFGRLGQAENTSLSGTTTPSPFLWDTAVAGARPGMMFSLFPEMGTQGASGFNSWTTTTTAPTVNYALKAFAAITSFDAPSAPAAATAITVGATQVAAASIVAAAAVASTMF